MIRTLSLALILLAGATTAPLAAQDTGTGKAPAAQAVPTEEGLHKRSLEIGGTEREYFVQVPTGYKKNPKRLVPMVLMLHGRGANGRRASSSYYGWSRLADREGFIAVFPSAQGRPTSWKAASRGRPTDDTAFLSQLITTLISDYAVDPERVYMTGHSSGGFMSYSFAALHPEKVAAIAPVAGLHVSAKGPATPVSVIAFHGMADDVVAYDKEHGKDATYRRMPSALDSAAVFAKSLAEGDEESEPERTELQAGQVLLDTWADGPRGTRVELYSLVGWGHGWPSARAKIEATPLIWAFFEEHGREPAPEGDDLFDFTERPDGGLQLVGKTQHVLVPESEGESRWLFEDGVLTASPAWDSVVTPASYQDFRMHVEFNVNAAKGEPHEANGNSGIYIQQRYEIQILNSFGLTAENYQTSDCGSLYKLKKPDRLVSRPAGQWQSFDILFRAARFDASDKMENAQITVFQNDELIHDSVSLERQTGAGKPEGSDARPIKLQGHQNEVRFRNVWIERLTLDTMPAVPQAGLTRRAR